MTFTEIGTVTTGDQRAVPAELLAHWLDHYGQCARDNGRKNDCYHGKDAAGRDNGCLKTGWRGRDCAHWQPIEGPELTWLIAAHTTNRRTRENGIG